MARASLLTSLFVLCLVGAVTQPAPVWNYTKCPHAWEVRAPHMVTDFNIQDLPGFYYEIALHDWTQYPVCPELPRCLSSNKTVHQHTDGRWFVNDTFNLHCFGRDFPLTLLGNTTDEPGELQITCDNIHFPLVPPHLLRNVVFPDAIVDFKPGPNGWALEFQCLEHLGRIGAEHGHIFFAAIQLYAKNKDDETAYQEMLQSIKARGLDFFTRKGEGLKRVDHTNCSAQPPEQHEMPNLLV